MPAVTVPELKAQLNIDHDLDDLILSQKIEAATAYAASYIGGTITDPAPAAIKQTTLTYFLADSDFKSLVKQVIEAAHDRADMERETKVRIVLHGFGFAPESCREALEADDRASARNIFDAAKAIQESATDRAEGLAAASQLFDRLVAPGTHEIELQDGQTLTLTVN